MIQNLRADKLISTVKNVGYPMEYESPLIEGRLVRRYKRFLSDVELSDGEMVTAHCANPGAMTGLGNPGAKVWLSRSINPNRKLAFSWQLVEINGLPVGINTSLPNKIVAEALENEQIQELHGYAEFQAEVKYGLNSRIDFLLSGGDQPACFLEVKNVNFVRQSGLAEFPDCVTKRGTKHLRELSQMVHQGHRAVMLYLIQRMDCDRFDLAGDIDPTYLEEFQAARQAGVEAICYDTHISLSEISLRKALPVLGSRA